MPLYLIFNGTKACIQAKIKIYEKLFLRKNKTSPLKIFIFVNELKFSKRKAPAGLIVKIIFLVAKILLN